MTAVYIITIITIVVILSGLVAFAGYWRMVMKDNDGGGND